MEDPRRRPDEYDRQGIGGSVLGPNITPGMMMPFFQGSPNYDFSGIQGQGGLQAFLQSLAQGPGRGFGPAGRHLRNVGQAVEFPGMDTQMDIAAPGGPIGGPNVAPGNPNGLAIGQTGALPPGIAQQQTQLQNTQGWRNLHPGYAIAAGAGFGSEQGMFGNPNFGGRNAPGATADAPGPSGGNRQNPPDLRQGAGSGGQRQVPAFGGPAQGTGGPPAAGTGGAPGGGGTKPKPGGVTPKVEQQSAQQSTARGGSSGGVQTSAGVDRGPNGKPKVDPKTGGVTSQGQGILQGPTANGPSTQVSVPNNGNNNTPSETGPKPNTPGKPKPKPGGNNNTPSEANYDLSIPTSTSAGKRKSTAKAGGGRPTRGGLAARRA